MGTAPATTPVASLPLLLLLLRSALAAAAGAGAASAPPPRPAPPAFVPPRGTSSIAGVVVGDRYRPPPPAPSPSPSSRRSLLLLLPSRLPISPTRIRERGGDEVAPPPPPPTEGGGTDKPADVRVTDASVLPSVPPATLIDVYYVEQAIQALGTIGDVVEAYHSGLVFRARDRAEGVPDEFTIEWYALDFPFGAFLPEIVDAEDGDDGGGDLIGLRWVNDAHAFYNPAYDPSRWTKGQVLVGTVDGDAFSSYAGWVVDFCDRRPGYQAFEVWDRPRLSPGRTRRWANSTTCSTFVEDSLIELYRLGGTCKYTGKGAAPAPREVLQRSYAPLIARTRPARVDASDPAQAGEVRDFYAQLSRAVRTGGDGSEGLSTSDFIRLLADRLEVFFVYDTRGDYYLRAELDPPYFALSQLYQPMSLPWQRLDLDGDGEMKDPGEFAPPEMTYAEELAGAASGIGRLLLRRLPPVLRKRIGPRIVVPAAALGAAAVIGTFQLASDGSFASGLLVGVVVGAAGSRLLGGGGE